MDATPESPDRLDRPEHPDDDLWSEAIWSAGLIGAVVGVIALLAQFA